MRGEGGGAKQERREHEKKGKSWEEGKEPSRRWDEGNPTPQFSQFETTLHFQVNIFIKHTHTHTQTHCPSRDSFSFGLSVDLRLYGSSHLINIVSSQGEGGGGGGVRFAQAKSADARSQGTPSNTYVGGTRHS